MRYSKLLFGYPGLCDACGKYCCTLDQVGIVCYHCFAGVFMHRKWWVQWRVGDDIVGTPREDIDLDELAAEWRGLGAKYRPPERLPAIIGATMEMVEPRSSAVPGQCDRQTRGA